MTHMTPPMSYERLGLTILFASMLVTHAGAQTSSKSSDAAVVGLAATYGVSMDTPIGMPDRGAEFIGKAGGLPADKPMAQGLHGNVDFSAQAFFRDCASDPIKTGLLPEIDAMSLGRDYIWIDSTGKIVADKDRWTGIVFSMRRGATGKSGSRVAEESGAGVGADLFGYIFRNPGCVCITGSFLGTVRKAWDAAELGLPPSSVAGAELSRVDKFMAAYATGMAESMGLPKEPRVYFSITGTPANIALVPASWWNGKPQSGATVFRSQWIWDSKSMTGQWSRPSGWFSPADMGLDDCEDLDALAYSEVAGKALFSTKIAASACRATPRNQMLFVEPGKDFAAAIVVHYDSSTTLTDDLGFETNDDLDGVCETDPPCDTAAATSGHNYGYAVGLPVRVSSLPIPLVYGQAHASRSAQGQMTYSIPLSGGPGGGFGVLFASPPNKTTQNPYGTLWPSVMIDLSVFVAIPAGPGPNGGKVVTAPLVAPASATKISVDLSWVALSLTPLAGYVSEPVRIYVP